MSDHGRPANQDIDDAFGTDEPLDLSPDDEYKKLELEQHGDELARGGFRARVEKIKAESAGEGEGEPGAGKPATPSAPAPATREDITTAITELAAKLVQPQSKQEPAMAPEEFYKKIGRWEPSEEALNKMLTSDDPAERLAAWNQMRDAHVNSSANIAMIAAQRAVAQLQQELAPVIQAVSEIHQQRQREDFFTTYPALKDHPDILDAMSAQYVAQGVQFKSKNEAYERLASDAEKLIKRFQPNFSIKSKPQQPQQQAAQSGPSHRMSSTSVGGTRGAGGAQSAKSSIRNEVEAAFGD